MSQCEDPATCPHCQAFRVSPEGIAIADGLAALQAKALRRRLLTPGRSRPTVKVQERAARVARKKRGKKAKASRKRNRR